MEQDCVAGLYQCLGLSAGAEFSSKDVSLLFHKVFHLPSNTDDAHAAMLKIAGGDNSWSCVGENVLDVLLEMHKELEQKEELYWDLQLLNGGNLNALYMTDKPNITNDLLNGLHHSSNTNTFNKGHSKLDLGSSLRERLVETKDMCESVRAGKRLKKAAVHCWARLASEGVHSIFPSPLHGQSLGVIGQAWGCVSLSDVLLQVEVKYDVVTDLLYREMLQEHYTLSVWENLLPWQQQKGKEELEGLAEEALESGDMLRLAELPGAFRIFRFCPGPSESKEESWSAVSLLYEINTFHQQEHHTLTVLGKRLNSESLSLVCLNIRLATLRAQREKTSYGALLAARQSWETWPHVRSPCRTEQAAMWLNVEEEQQKKHLISVSPQQQAVLKLLVLTQEQERNNLVKLVRGVSLEDLQEPGCTVLLKEESHEQALRNGCIRRMRQLRAGLQTHDDTQSARQANPQPQLKPQLSSEPVMWAQHQLEECSLLLLTHLIELQEAQASALLPGLMDTGAQSVRALGHEYESGLQAQLHANPLQKLLTSDEPLTSGSGFPPYPNVAENCSKEQITVESCCIGPVYSQNSNSGPTGTATVNLISRQQHEVQAADLSDRQDVCAGCGVVMEDLPYLEILCVSDERSNADQEGARGEEAEGSELKSPQSYEKQGSLITLAWSKPPEDDTDYEVRASINQDAEVSVKPGDVSSTMEKTQCEETSVKKDREGQCDHIVPDALSANQQCTAAQLTTEETPTAAQPEKAEAVTHCDLQREEMLQDDQPHLLADPHQLQQRDPCSSLTNGIVEVDREVVNIETCPCGPEPEAWDLRGPEDTSVDLKEEKEAKRESTLMARERTREPVSAVEREKTMRNLVDMQRKVEQRQQRDKERQLLRVQERLSIIQNRKAEEDLLGLKHTDRLRHLTQDLPREDKNHQKTVVKERLEQLRRERSYVMQSKRDRNTAGFKELLGPVAQHSRETDDGAD